MHQADFLIFTALASGETNQLHQFLDKILLKLTYDKWFFGCYHGIPSFPPRAGVSSVTSSPWANGTQSVPFDKGAAAPAVQRLLHFAVACAQKISGSVHGSGFRTSAAPAVPAVRAPALPVAGRRPAWQWLPACAAWRVRVSFIKSAICKVGRAVLTAAEKVAGAAGLEVVLRHGKAVRGAAQKFQPLFVRFSLWLSLTRKHQLSAAPRPTRPRS